MSYSAVEHEPPEVAARNLRVGVQLWASATVFFFFAFLFAFFYLRELNEHHLWRPKHVDPSMTLGTLSVVAVVIAAVLARIGLVDHRGLRLERWRLLGAAAVASLLVAVGLQVAEWATQGFGPTDGAYASVYVGWTGLFALFLIGLAYWLETVVATSVRYRKTGGELPPGEAAGDAHRSEHDIADALKLLEPELEGASFYATFLAAVGVAGWIVLYLVK
jgi:heme/copper-type cytochrome/quinol oxidase subunit 3